MTLFPNTPSVGDTVSFGSVVYKWNGTEWFSLGEVAASQGPKGDTGPRGLTGNTGEQVIAKTYAVTWASTDSGNKYFIDGVTQGTIYHLRGQKYVYSLDVPNHPFRFQTDSGAGYCADTEYTSGVENAGATTGNIIFTVPYNAPDTLYYRCELHSGMGGVIIIKNLTPNDLQGNTGPIGDTGPPGSGGGGGGTTLAAGAGMALSATVSGVGHTLGIDPTATIHVAGVSSDGKIKIPYDEYIGISGSSEIQFQSGAIRIKPGDGAGVVSFTASTSAVVASKPFNSVELLTASSGINLSTLGITFPDGSYQSTSPADLDGTVTSPFTPSTVGFVTADSVSGVVTLTQAQYDNIVGGPSGDVVYIISDAVENEGTLTSPYTPSAAGFVTADSVSGVVTLTQAQYDGITGGPSGDVVYIISDAAANEGTLTSPYTPSAAGFVTADSVSGVVTLTQAQYDGITGGPSGDVVYVISDAAANEGTLTSPYTPSAAGFVTADSVSGVVTLTQAQYDGITGGPSGDVVYVISDAALNSVELLNGLTGGITLNAGTNITIASGVGGITFNSSGGVGGGGTTLAAGAGMTLSSAVVGVGHTLGIDSSVTIHVSGVTLPDDGTLGNASGSYVELAATQIRLKPLNTLSFASLNTKNVSHKDLQVQGELIANNVIIANEGITLTKGITFPDGTFQSTATVIGSYHEHIETIANKTYYVDSRVPTERTIAEVYAIASSGGCTAAFSGTNGLITTIVGVGSTGKTGSLVNNTLPVGGTFEMTISDNTSCVDFRFGVRYNQ